MRKYLACFDLSFLFKYFTSTSIFFFWLSPSITRHTHIAHSLLARMFNESEPQLLLMPFFLLPQNFSEVVGSPLAPSKALRPKDNLLSGISDGVLAVLAPVFAYWLYSFMFHLLDHFQLAEKYRIHPSEEEQARNKVPSHEVLRDVAFQHVLQTVVGMLVLRIDEVPTTGDELYQMWYLKQNYFPSFVPDSLLWFAYSYGWSFLKIAVCLLFIDTWQYWLHRIMHESKFLYRRFHSRHHRLYVPYSFGALYNDPVEGFLLDTLGTGLVAFLLKLTPREGMFLFTFATMKTVDDHCGYRFPFDPFQILFPNNALYHDIHHQSWGFRFNYSQPFFTFWDVMSDTQYKFVREYQEKQKQITLEKYKEFLAARKLNNETSERELKKTQ